jgi:hypothetical protein
VTTVIEFIGRERTIRVNESTDKVLEKIAASADRPFTLEALDGWTVYVNPGSVACWYEQVEQVNPGRLDPDRR